MGKVAFFYNGAHFCVTTPNHWGWRDVVFVEGGGDDGHIINWVYTFVFEEIHNAVRE